VSAADVANFLCGQLDVIEVGTGLGNSIQDLRLSYIGWRFGKEMPLDKYPSCPAVADWIKTELGDVTLSPLLSGAN
jgi:hypothetical protein